MRLLPSEGCLLLAVGHSAFLLLHVAAFFLGCVGLLITIPLHCVFTAIMSR